MSPVCSMNSGTAVRLLILSTAALRVPATSGFAGLLNPMWLSLICTKLSSPIMSAVLISDNRLKLYELSTPPFITQKAPVPAHAMHFRKPRRSIPSWLWSCRSSSFFFSDILALHTYFFYPVSKLCTCRWDWRRGVGWGLPAPPLHVLASIQTEAAPLLFQILRVHGSLHIRHNRAPSRIKSAVLWFLRLKHH